METARRSAAGGFALSVLEFILLIGEVLITLMAAIALTLLPGMAAGAVTLFVVQAFIDGIWVWVIACLGYIVAAVWTLTYLTIDM